jgi:hypothetical protein
MDHASVLGLTLALGVGLVLGLLGGGGSMLALPIMLYVFRVPTKPAVAMSLAVVGMSAFVGFLSHWRQGTVHLRVAVPFGVFAMIGAFVSARLAHMVPASAQLFLFGLFALTAALLMLRDAMRPVTLPDSAPPPATPRFAPLLALQAIGVGVLTSLIGAGGGFIIVPALVLIARVPVKAAVGSSLLIITLNALAGFVGYIGQLPMDWSLIGAFTSVAALGAVIGAKLVPFVPQRRIKQGFAVMIILLGGYIVLRGSGLLP